ncbi:unnamed protein product [Arabis nemorensis]|uniref:Uncharacterized protein n=1 Tax=Arabis nemorensis TaxID=586526 RepID=A0A565BRI2_9BRAS|nr:unnamed protein product [Arabis nemorensis]
MDFFTDQVKKKFSDKKPESSEPDPNHNKNKPGHSDPTHKPVSHADPNTHRPATNAELMASAKIVAEAAQAAARNESNKLDKAKVAGATADILDAASRYGKLDEKSGVGQYLEKAEQYLHKYETSHSHSSGGHGGVSGGAVHGGDGGHGGVGGTGSPAAKKEDGKSGGGFGDYAKMAQAIPSLSSSQPLTTPFTQSKFLQTGLLNGKIRPCPSTNPGCVSTNPTSSSFAFPLSIPETDTQDPIQKLKEAIVKTQKNPKFLVLEDTPYGRYLEAEVEGSGFSRDLMEFLVKKDVVAYRCMATKVTFVYPFTTAFGDSKGQEEKMKKLVDELALANQGYRGEVSITAYKEKKPIRNDFELAGINLQIAGDKRGRSKCMIDDFFPWVLDNRDGTNILVISRDKAYFANYLGRSVAENHNILLAESEDPPEKCCKCGVALDKPPPVSDKRDLVGEEWVWTSLAFGGDPIIKTKNQ